MEGLALGAGGEPCVLLAIVACGHVGVIVSVACAPAWHVNDIVPSGHVHIHIYIYIHVLVVLAHVTNGDVAFIARFC